MKADLLIAGGRVIDGTGAPAIESDVVLADGLILALGAPGSFAAWDVAERLDAQGRVVTPGFIDVHSHDDRAVFATPDMTAKVSQGVTTVIAGNCGVSLAPLVLERDPPTPMNVIGARDDYRFPTFEAYIAAIEADPPALNIALLVGHSTLRAGVMDNLGRAATAGEIDMMGERLAAALEAGAMGLSTGLAYPTAAAAPTEEVIALAALLPQYGAVYTTHMRDEADQLLESVDETLEIGRRSGARTVISHHKACGRDNWGKTATSLAQITQARQKQHVDLDVYPYTASSSVLMPEWLGRCERVLITWSEPHPEMAGLELTAIAAKWCCNIHEAAQRLQPAGAIYFQMDEGDLRRVLAFPRTMIGSDGLPHDSRPHPRLWGTFPRVLGHFCRELGLLGLEEAVHRMTGIPAEVFALKGRGRIAEGEVADIVIFDPQSVIDRADYRDPTRPAAGIDRVLVAGTTVWDGNAATRARPGRFLRRDPRSSRSMGTLPA